MPRNFELKGEPIIAFVPTRDAERAREFYRDRLGLPLRSDELPFALVFDVNGVMLRVTVVKDLAPAGHTILGWRVGDIYAAAESLRERGVQFQRYTGMNQDDAGVWTAPDGTKLAWFQDPDGNTLSITQFE